MHKALVVACLAAFMSACASAPAPTSSPLPKGAIRAIADDMIPFAREVGITVTPQDESSIAQRQLVGIAVTGLITDGIRYSDSDFGYVLKIGITRSENLETVYQTMTTTSDATAYSQYGSVKSYGSSTTRIPVDQIARYLTVTANLWDVRAATDALRTATAASQDSIKIWSGAISMRATEVDGREHDAIRQLVSQIGRDARTEISLRQNHEVAPELYQARLALKAPASSGSQRSAISVWSPHFSVRETRVTRVTWGYNGETFKGYRKTVAVKTNQFQGFAELEGHYGPDGPFEIPSTLGTYSVLGDGVYQSPTDDIRSIDSARLDKMFSIPFVAGERTSFPKGPGQLTYTTERTEDLRIGDVQYVGCLVFSLKATLNGEGDTSRHWYCPGVGFAKSEAENGVVTSLVPSGGRTSSARP